MVKMHMLSQRGVHGFRTQMMCFLFETEHGHFIVIDGGNKGDTEYFHGYLQALAGPKAKIDLWILTHAHNDHTDVLYEMQREFADEFSVDCLAYRFYDKAYAEENEPASAHTISEMNELKPEFLKRGTRIAAPEAGDRFCVDGVEIEILRVPSVPIAENCLNNSSMVFRVDACGQSILFLGDLGKEGGDEVLRTVPREKLKADFVQLAHHGQDGVRQSFYQSLPPFAAALWCAPAWLWDNDAGGGFDTHVFRTVTTRKWMKELGVKCHFVAKDGTQVIELPYRF